MGAQTSTALQKLGVIVHETWLFQGRTLDRRQDELPLDPSVYVEDVLLSGFDQWRPELQRQGYILEQEHGWKDPVSHYPAYTLRTAAGEKLALTFHGRYPDNLFLTVGHRRKRLEQMSDAHGAHPVRLPLTMDPNGLFQAIQHAADSYLQDKNVIARGTH